MLLAPLLAVAVLAVIALVLQWQRHAQRHLVGRVIERDRPPGRPSILFFTGATCTICDTAQRPALQSLSAKLGGDVGIREVDVAVEPALARSYRVMSLPTTIVLDDTGQVRDVNVGFATTETLLKELEAIGIAVAA